MKVAMRVHPFRYAKLHKNNKTMRVADHVVGMKWADFEIDEASIHHLETVGTKYWVEIADAGTVEEESVVSEEDVVSEEVVDEILESVDEEEGD